MTSKLRRNRRRRPAALAALAILAIALLFVTAPPRTASAQTHPTPEIAEITEIPAPDTVAYVMRARLGHTNTYVGMSLVCAPGNSPPVEVTAYFGGFPADARPVQLAVGAPRGTVHRFGPVLRGTPRSGFHSPRITDPDDARKFADAALRPGALVSNGYRSFRNRIPEAANRRARAAFLRCLQRNPP